jgi:hypothetical protein
MRRARERILVLVGAIRPCVFCFEQKPVVAVDRAANGEAEYVCADCHLELSRDISSSLGRARR